MRCIDDEYIYLLTYKFERKDTKSQTDLSTYFNLPNTITDNNGLTSRRVLNQVVSDF